MKATLIRIENILGIEDMTIKPGTITEITGLNGQGKTSIIEAIRSIGVKGHDATLIRKGADEGRIVVELDNGGTITKRIRPDKTDRTYKTADGARAGATAIEAILDVVSVNPVEFLSAEPKRQLEILLEAIDLPLTDEELTAAAGFPCTVSGGALECMGAIYKQIYDERTGVGRVAREKKATLNQLSESVPSDVAEDPTAAIAQTQARIDAAATRRDTDRLNILKDRDARIAQIQQEAADAIAAIDAQYENIVEPLKADVVRMQEQLTQKGRFDQVRATIKRIEEEIEEYSKQEASCTAALERLKALKAAKMADMPFPGLNIVDGQILVNGIEFHRLNTSEQVKFAINLAIRRAGDLRMICVDGLELIDPQRYEKFKEAVAKMTDYQFFITRVSGEPLSVETV